MAEALTRKQIIQAVWNKFKAIIGNHDISGIGDGTVTGALAGLNGNMNKIKEKFIYEGRIVNPNNSNIFYISKPGYSLIHASNGNWDAANNLVKGIARQNGSDIIFFESAQESQIQLTLLWARDD